MIENNQIMNALIRSYETKRINAQNKAYEVSEKLSLNQEWVSNRYAIKDKTLKIAKAKYEGNNGLVLLLEKERKELLLKREEILKSYNLTERDLSPRYECAICQDTGFLQTGVCECFYKNLAKICAQTLNLPEQRFPSFEQFTELNPNSLKLKALLEKYVEKFPPVKVKNLILMGSSGVGKTFSAQCIANSLIEKNYNVIFLTAVKLNEVFLSYHTASLSDKQAIFSLLTSCDLLIIDDLGTEPLLANVTAPYLTAVISERITSGAPFVITTNLNLDELKTRYTERFSSRISGNESARILVDGEDLRRKK